MSAPERICDDCGMPVSICNARASLRIAMERHPASAVLPDAIVMRENALASALRDISEARGMEGLSDADDLEWAVQHAGRTLAALGLMEPPEPVKGREGVADVYPTPTALDPDMPADELRLHMGELTDQEVLTARAAIRWANSAHAAQVETLREALGKIATHDVPVIGEGRLCDHGRSSDENCHGCTSAFARAALSAVSRDDTSEVSDV